MVALAVEVTMGVAFRYTGNALVWYDEVASILLAWVTYYGAALAALKRAHIGVPELVHMLPPAPQMIGQPVNGEIKLLSGISAVNVHWEPGGAQPPFGRPYENNVCRWSKLERPSRVLLFGDGHSDVRLEWPNDRWWIWKYDSPNTPGFNRVAQGDKGSVRHSRRSNYALADGSAATLDAGRIPCNLDECWWSAKADPH